MLRIKDHVACRRCQLVRFMDLPSSRLRRVILLVEVPNRFKLDGLKRIAVVERSSRGMASFLPDTSPTSSLPRMDRVDASKKTVVDIRFFYRAMHYEAKKGRRPRGRRKRGKAEDDEGDAREFLASVPRPISTRVYSSGCALHGAQCNGRRYGRVAS